MGLPLYVSKLKCFSIFYTFLVTFPNVEKNLVDGLYIFFVLIGIGSEWTFNYVLIVLLAKKRIGRDRIKTVSHTNTWATISKCTLLLFLNLRMLTTYFSSWTEELICCLSCRQCHHLFIVSTIFIVWSGGVDCGLFCSCGRLHLLARGLLGRLGAVSKGASEQILRHGTLCLALFRHKRLDAPSLRISPLRGLLALHIFDKSTILNILELGLKDWLSIGDLFWGALID